MLKKDSNGLIRYNYPKLVVTIAHRAKRTQLTKKVQCRTQWFDGLGNRYIYACLLQAAPNTSSNLKI